MFRAIITTFLLSAGALGLGMAIEQKPDAPPSPWKAPEEARAKPNPIPESFIVLKEGQTLYEKNCLTCHGTEGRGDGPAAQFVERSPANISLPEPQNRMTDGEIFWKITEGRNPMPSFRVKLSEEERWKLVVFLRSLRGEP